MAVGLRGGFDPGELGRQPRRRYNNVHEVERAYVEGRQDAAGHHVWPTLREVADDFDIGPGRVRAWAARGCWVQKRDSYRAELQEARWRCQAQVRAHAAEAVDVQAVHAAAAGLAAVLARFEELHDLNELPSDPSAPSVLSGFELHRLSRAALTWQAVGLAALGQSPPRRPSSGS